MNSNLESCELGPTSDRKRRQEAFQIREEAAIFQKDIPLRAIRATAMKISIQIRSAIFPRRCRTTNSARLTSMLIGP